MLFDNIDDNIDDYIDDYIRDYITDFKVGINCCWNQVDLLPFLSVQFVVRSRHARM